MDVEIRHLRMIRAISEVGSLSGAAIQLGLTQPALTRQLQRLERAFGGTLFHRDRNGTRPTALGELVVQRARVLVPSVDELIQEARQHTAPLHTGPTQIRIVAHPTPLPGPVTERLYELAPEASITLRQERSGQTAMELLAGGAADLGVLAEHPAMPLDRLPGVAVHTIATEPLFIAVATGHSLANEFEISLADLSEENWILPQGLEIRCAEYLRGLCANAGFIPRIAYRLDSANAREFIRTGLGVMLAQATFRLEEGISVRPFHGARPDFRHILAVRTDSPVARLADTLVSSAIRAYWAKADQAPVYRSWLSRTDELAG
ncbi:LysR family transcriptional regulator [Crossiella sp. CA-258035]|uniref:LysR family transcriptional regulator n=1 Tax=Crossiella sp. CA-258035 TaxID=2981138 RepID=UPI0024BCCB63|nr:LysR family transcriptional regulator [Crossiella sp. CA-258035]WHT15907.1 LysR family transcriptional regulator [Crossiella sp. CA-258035]